MNRRVFTLCSAAAAVSVNRLRAAGVDGQWEATLENPNGKMVVTFDLKAEGESLTGTIASDMMGEAEIQKGKINGDEVSFIQLLQRGQRQMRFKFEGKLMGDEMELTRSMDRPGGGQGGQGGRAQGGGGRGRGMGRPVTFKANRVE